MRPLSEHLFGLAAPTVIHVIPYCTCGLIFSRQYSTGKATTMRKEWVEEWVEHVRKVRAGAETRDPLA